MDKEQSKELEKILVKGLETEGGHHKQWYLFKALECVNQKTFKQMVAKVGKGKIEDGIQ